jgi:hypothetical protein
MKNRHSLLVLLAAAAIVSLLVASCGRIPEQLPELGPPDQGEESPGEPAPTEPPEPEATEPPPEPEPTEPPPEPEPTEPPPEPQPTTPREPQPTTAPPPEPEPEEPPAEGQPSRDWGQLLLWGIGLAVVVGIVIGVVAFFAVGRREEAVATPEVPSVPITTVAEDIKQSRVSKIVVSGEDLTITRLDGVVMTSHKEPTADLVQLMTNLGVEPEMMSSIVIEVETPEPPAG